MLVDLQNIDEVWARIEAAKEVWCDTETTGLRVWQGDRIVGVAVATIDKEFYFPFRHPEATWYDGPEAGDAVYVPYLDRKDWDSNLLWKIDENLDIELLPKLIELLYSKPNFWWNALFDLDACYQDYPHHPDREKVGDIMLLAHLVDENAPDFKLKNHGRRLIDANAGKAEEEMLKKVGKKALLSQLPAREVAEYAENDVFLTRELHRYYMPRLKDQGRSLSHIWAGEYNVNKYLLAVARMQSRGIRVDMDAIDVKLQECLDHMAPIHEELVRISGREDFNPGSWQQVKKAMPGHTGSTARDVLEAIADDKVSGIPEGNKRVARLVVEWRKWDKMRGTYYEAYKRFADRDNVIHPNLKLHGTVSGRLSASEPNLQAVPRKVEGDPHTHVKDVFIAREGHILVNVDWSQAELRFGSYCVAMHKKHRAGGSWTPELEMLKLMGDGGDIHEDTAERFGLVRDIAKRINFGIIYGLGAPGLAAAADIPEPEAKEYIDRYNSERNGFRKLRTQLDNIAKSASYIELWSGRRRHYNKFTYTHKAMSNLIQGGVAELMRVVIEELDRQIVDSGRAYQLLQVHDSILFEIPDDNDKYRTIADIRNIMEFRNWSPARAGRFPEETFLFEFPHAHNFPVPMMVDIQLGKRWGDMEDPPPEWDNDDGTHPRVPRYERTQK